MVYTFTVKGAGGESKTVAPEKNRGKAENGERIGADSAAKPPIARNGHSLKKTKEYEGWGHDERGVTDGGLTR